ncbi:GDSL-type esterase/lipase family protein [Roseofilum casamattae]|uniref:GDSL-type esterase/lipase family protein n=1 Tax=Roseofilum casamattae BLCC-M143 TaxID=3022442 RepID=A0ABT7BWF5_9CYAN|nr:GDSL-type esterase/lipase family protein [Roseofilum casamattae]MDJ1183506.1 GDSL-type esterase/lipase family protein [Roseofilum casamattae BLCC-M143]
MFSRRKRIPIWAGLSLSANLLLGLLSLQGQGQIGVETIASSPIESRASEGRALSNSDSQPNLSTTDPRETLPGPGQAHALPVKAPLKAPPDLPKVTGPKVNSDRHLTYQEWVELLGREAQLMAQKQPDNLAILAGDSISLWFPPALLPHESTWLNQGISGETSLGLYRRLPLLDRTKPQQIFILIGINDLLKGISDREVLENHRKIIQDLKQYHPQAQIVVQSILPHQSKDATWEGREKLLAVPNLRIRQLNQDIETLARQQNVHFLDLYPLFTTADGTMRPDLTTDGLHLNHQGYLIWSSAMQLFSQIQLASQP